MLAVAVPVPTDYPCYPPSIAESYDDNSQSSADSIGSDYELTDVASEADDARFKGRSSTLVQHDLLDSHSIVPNAPSKNADGCRHRYKDWFKLPTLLGRQGSKPKPQALPVAARSTTSSQSGASIAATPTDGSSILRASTESSAKLAEELFSTIEQKRRTSLTSSVLLCQSRQELRHTLVVILEEPFGSRDAWCLSLFFIVTNCVALILLCQEHVVADSDSLTSTWGIITVVVNCVGTLEAIVRIIFSPRRRRSLGHTPNFLDAACVVPFWVFRVAHLDLLFGWSSLVLVSRLELWLRLMKFSRYFGGWKLLFLAISEAGPALMLPLVALILIMGFGACIILIAEEASEMHGDSQNIVIVGFPDALRFCLLCIIAIDAGPFYDLELKSEYARVFVCALMMCGLVVFAMPMSIVGTCFCRVWFQRHRLLFIEAVRRRVERGTLQSTTQKLQDLFDRFACSNPELGITEFRQFVHCITPNMRAEVVLSIFASFDQDQDGCVSFQEVHAAVFPEDADLEFLITPKVEEEQDNFEGDESEMPHLFNSETDAERDASSAKWLHKLESRLRAIERRHHEAPMTMPPWCHMAPSPVPTNSSNLLNFRSSKQGSRRTSIDSYPPCQQRRNSNSGMTSHSHSRASSRSNSISISQSRNSFDRVSTLPIIRDDVRDDGEGENDQRISDDNDMETHRRIPSKESIPTMIISPPGTNINCSRRRASCSSLLPGSMPQGPRFSHDGAFLGIGNSANKLSPRRQSLGTHSNCSSCSSNKLNAWPADDSESVMS